MLSSTERAQRLPGSRWAARLVLALVPMFAGVLGAAGEEAADSAQATLVGDAVCESCHQDKVHSFHKTAHARTSSMPSADTIHGLFSPGSNILATINANLVFTMEANERGYFQTAHMRTSASEELNRSERIDVVVGSGRKGQTYLFWDGDQLFELPVSYWTDRHGWINSPGYIDGAADFERPIVPRCLECHSSSFENRPPPENRYAKSSLVLGVSCEKCHGAGSEHVARFRSASPPTSPARFAIVNPARLSRARQLDVCALCHNGAGEPLVASLSFVPGDDLSQFIAFSRADPKARVDVHARQVPLLERSRCFRFSKTLTCTTCHDVHVEQRDTASFAPKCMTCHKIEDCRVFPKLGHAIDTRCVDCHMPLQETGKIVSQLDGSAIRPMVRNHQIAIYPGVSLPGDGDSSHPR
jgi:Cytochrome c554 and c-prime